MIKIKGPELKGPELTNFDLLAKATIGPGITTTGMNLKKRPDAPKFIRPVDVRPSTFKVLGKSNPDSIIMSRDTGVGGRDGVMPHFGNFRNQDGFLSGLDPQVNTKVSLMPRPDSAMPFLHTKIAQPK